MANQPRIEERAEQTFVGVRGRVTWDTFGQLADRLPEIVGWLGERGIPVADGPFFKYEVLDPADRTREFEVVAGVPVGERVRVPHGELFAGALPAGRYVTVRHVGHPDELFGVTATVLKWAAAKGLVFDMEVTDEGEVWGCRLESYKTDPRTEPDLHKWETELSFRLQD
ncbi:GyrI-like domain-containing protein [Streptomyces cavernicola]|uniref:GyrI-like domain-containing protein n=1 Tax=Streptomyces cavernicola TaxID=3043613 RepID=A0ABT6SBX2_9ACTN|nr:GyrI-like domain-containing protein [Streptomyces sp. B-S-A6]MDI3405289.1 GyrI-like domain-containing protein [Streptomyces sp. B-S-A6]